MPTYLAGRDDDIKNVEQINDKKDCKNNSHIFLLIRYVPIQFV